MLTMAADLVCRGRVERVVDEGTTTYLVASGPIECRQRLADLIVDHAYRSAPESDRIQVELLVPDAPSAVADLQEGEDVVLFLRHRSGRYILVDPNSGKIDRRSPAGAPRAVIQQALQEATDRTDADVARVARELLADLDWA